VVGGGEGSSSAPTRTLDRISLALANRKPGDTVRVTARRPDGPRTVVSVTLGQLRGIWSSPPPSPSSSANRAEAVPATIGAICASARVSERL
jgi:hypothetical protein